MKGSHTDPAPADQNRRIRVGMIGLAAVVLLIGLASAIFSSVNHDRPVTAVGTAKQEVVVNMAAPGAQPSAVPSNEPLAELGVTPGAAGSPTPEPHN
jgi:hypothetical protein